VIAYISSTSETAGQSVSQQQALFSRVSKSLTPSVQPFLTFLRKILSPKLKGDGDIIFRLRTIPMTFCLRGVGPVKADVTLFPMELPGLVASCLLSARHQDPIPLQKIIAGGVRAFCGIRYRSPIPTLICR
jgi:hypothetical protein